MFTVAIVTPVSVMPAVGHPLTDAGFEGDGDTEDAVTVDIDIELEECHGMILLACENDGVNGPIITRTG
jgi:hypothetical protein